MIVTPSPCKQPAGSISAKVSSFWGPLRLLCIWHSCVFVRTRLHLQTNLPEERPCVFPSNQVPGACKEKETRKKRKMQGKSSSLKKTKPKSEARHENASKGDAMTNKQEKRRGTKKKKGPGYTILRREGKKAYVCLVMPPNRMPLFFAAGPPTALDCTG